MFIHTLWGQILFWGMQAIIGLFASKLLLMQMKHEAEDESRLGDARRYGSFIYWLGGGVVFGGILAASAAPGFFWGGNWVYTLLIPVMVAVVVQAYATVDRVLPFAPIVLGVMADGMFITGSTLLPLSCSLQASVINVSAFILFTIIGFLGRKTPTEEKKGGNQQ